MTDLFTLAGAFRDAQSNAQYFGGYLLRSGTDITGRATDQLGDSEIRGTLDFPKELLEFERRLSSGQVINYHFDRVDGTSFGGTNWIGNYSVDGLVSRPVIACTGLVFTLDYANLPKLVEELRK